MDTTILNRTEQTSKEFWTSILTLASEQNTGNSALLPNRIEFGSERVTYKPSAQSCEILDRYTQGNDLARFVLLASAITLLVRKYTGKQLVVMHTTFLRKKNDNEYQGIPLPAAIQFENFTNARNYVKHFRDIMTQVFTFQNSVLNVLPEIPEADVLIFDDNLSVSPPLEMLQNYKLVFQVNTRIPEVVIHSGVWPGSFSAHRLESHLEYLLLQFRDLDSPISELRYFDEQVEPFILSGAQRLPAGTTHRLSLIEGFKKHSQSNRAALIYHQVTLTYQELDQHLEDLSAFLATQTFHKTGMVVAVISSNPVDRILYYLASLKLGYIIVAIDDSQPKARLDYFLKESGAQVVLSDDAVAYVLEQIVTLPVLRMERLNLSGHNRTKTIWHQIAFILFTSGSTGDPRGVLVRQDSIVGRVENFIDYFRVTQEERMLQFSSAGFDAGLFEIFTTFLSGATLVLTDKETKAGGGSFCSYLAAHQVTMALLPPAYLRMLEGQDLFTLKKIIVGGEEAIVEDAIFYSRTKEFYNAYGPTECTIIGTAYRVDDKCIDVYRNKQLIPIGAALDDTQLYILNEQLEGVPAGVIGEIFIGGSGLAEGYVNDHELTNFKFVTNAQSHNIKDGQRLYRTGDLGYIDSSGIIYFKGRKDRQVKLRGIRIELGEVERAVAKCSGVNKVVVKAVTDSQRTMSLIAYLLCSDDFFLEKAFSFLKGSVPSYMIPSTFVRMKSFPLNANGKVDVSKLTIENGQVLSVVGCKTTQPLSNLHQKLIDIWQEILNRQELNEKDNFYEVGGHSLKAMQLISRIEEKIGVVLSLAQIFGNPTIESLAHKISEIRTSRLNVIPKLDVQLSYETSHAQRSYWIVDQVGASSEAYNVFSALQLNGPISASLLEETLAVFIQRHEILRTVFRAEEGEPRQLIRSAHGAEKILEWMDVSGHDDLNKKVDENIKQITAAAFDLAEGPLYRFALIKLDHNKYVLCLVFHHIIFDGWSFEVLIVELTEIYRALLKGAVADLPPLSIQYKEFAAWHNALVKKERASSTSYWKQKFAGVYPFFRLPGDIPSSNRKNRNASFVSYSANKITRNRLDHACKEHGVTPFMLCLTAFNIALYKYSGETNIIVGTPVAGRPTPALQQQIGLFLNAIPLFAPVRQGIILSDYLLSVKSVVIEAQENQFYPFDLLTEDFSAFRDNDYHPFFEVFVDMLHENILHQSASAAIDGVTVTPYPTPPSKKCKFDLTVYFREGEMLVLDVEYNQDMYSTVFIRKMMQRFENLLDVLLNNAFDKIDDLKIETEIALPTFKKTML